jgi:hypothetical protein
MSAPLPRVNDYGVLMPPKLATSLSNPSMIMQKHAFSI